MLEYICCFCGEKIISIESGITSLLVVSHWDKSLQEQQEQQLFCHMLCLKNKLHNKIPLYLLDIEDDQG